MKTALIDPSSHGLMSWELTGLGQREIDETEAQVTRYGGVEL